MTPEKEHSPLSKEALLSVFTKANRQDQTPLIGIEHEKISFLKADGGAVPYFGERGIHQMMLQLCARYGWEPEYYEGMLLSLSRGKAHITLEPGGQVELSGTASENLLQIKREFVRHLKEVICVCSSLGIELSSLGYHPGRHPQAIEFVPKPRYPLMRHYFQRLGGRGIYMMGNTATAQVNLDLGDEATSIEKFRAAQLASPYVTAIFANSPIAYNALTPYQSIRYWTWLDVDPARCGLLPQGYGADFSYQDYVDWAANAPLFGLYRQGTFIPCGVLTFGEFLERGYDGFHATYDDWIDHLSTVFPEVRLKHTLEVRGADSGGLLHTLSLAGLWRGLLDDPVNRRRIIAEIAPPSSPRHFQYEIARCALRASDDRGPVLERCLWLLKIAKQGLYALSEPLADTVLEPVEEALMKGLCPADEWRLSEHSLSSTLKILEQASYHFG